MAATQARARREMPSTMASVRSRAEDRTLASSEVGEPAMPIVDAMTLGVLLRV